MKKLEKVGDVAALASFLLESGCTPDMAIVDAMAKWAKLPISVRIALATRHPQGVMIFAVRDYPLSREEYDQALRLFAGELRVEKVTLASIAEAWEERNSDTQAYLSERFALIIAIIEGKTPDPYGDPTVVRSTKAHAA